MNPSPTGAWLHSRAKPVLFWHLAGEKLLIMFADVLRRGSFKCFREWAFAVIKETYRCRSSLSWAFVIADDTFRLVRHQIRQAFLGLWALITANSLWNEMNNVLRVHWALSKNKKRNENLSIKKTMLIEHKTTSSFHDWADISSSSRQPNPPCLTSISKERKKNRSR